MRERVIAGSGHEEAASDRRPTDQGKTATLLVITKKPRRLLVGWPICLVGGVNFENGGKLGLARAFGR